MLDRSLGEVKIQRTGTPFHSRKIKKMVLIYPSAGATWEEFGKFVGTDNKLSIKGRLAFPAVVNN